MTVRSLLLGLLILTRSMEAQAVCGIDVCPVKGLSQTTGSHDNSTRVALPQLIRATGATVDGQSATYVETIIRGEIHSAAGLTAGVALPVIVLSTDDHSVTGIGNLLGFAQWGTKTSWGTAAFGLQMEAPIGDSDEGLASEHFEILPYAQSELALGPGFAFVDVGFRYGLGGEEHAPPADDGHSHSHGVEEDQHGDGLIVNPHGDRELLYRLGAGITLLDDRLQPRVYVSGIQVFDADANETTLLTVGTDIALGILPDLLDVRTLVEIPVSQDKRFDWRVGLAVNVIL